MSEQYSPDWVRAVTDVRRGALQRIQLADQRRAARQSLDAAAAYFRNEYETMFRENLKEIEPVYRGGMTGKPQ